MANSIEFWSKGILSQKVIFYFGEDTLTCYCNLTETKHRVTVLSNHNIVIINSASSDWLSHEVKCFLGHCLVKWKLNLQVRIQACPAGTKWLIYPQCLFLTYWYFSLKILLWSEEQFPMSKWQWREKEPCLRCLCMICGASISTCCMGGPQGQSGKRNPLSE